MVLRRKLMALLMTVMLVVMSAAPALADRGKPKRSQPTEPPGRSISEGTEAEHAADPETGRGNRIHHGCQAQGECVVL